MVLYAPNSGNTANTMEVMPRDYEKAFLKHLCFAVTEGLRIPFAQQQIFTDMLFSILEHTVINNNDGLLKQYLHSQLDITKNTIVREFGLSGDIKTDYSHATHAKFNSLISAIKEKGGVYDK